MRFPRARLPISHRPAPGGFALVLVLMLIFLMAVLVVAVFSTVGTETKASTASSNGQVARQMADLAVQVVKSQLQTATTQGPTTAWASQPGMIRCYNNTGAETKWYKLYSAESMVQNGPGAVRADVPAQDYISPGSTNYGVFTDLNSPVLSADGSTLVYPVVDPRSALSLTTGANTTVAGFDIDLANLPPGYQSGSPASATNNPAAMPVRWLYVLKDGTLVPAASSGTAGRVSVSSATRENPVVGRVAFWTDDESSKLNINTAGDGSYFDTPRFNSAAPSSSPASDSVRLRDQQLAVSPPYVGEYQRYVGHPAQTRLSYALPKILAADSFTRTQTLSSITPFLQWIGTQGGSRTIYQMGDMNGSDSPPARQTPYASVDEWMFGSGAVDTNGQRPLNKFLDGTNLVTNDSLGRSHFFLTATSEAPEVNLYGKPRVSIWPIHNDYYASTLAQPSKYTTALDRMIAHASSLKQSANAADGDHYFFTRADSISQTNDFTQIPNNQSLYAYLQSFAAAPVPGYGNSFNTKYGSDGANQILTEAFDYIRSTNINDPALMAPGWSNLKDVSATQTDYSYAKYRTDYWGWEGRSIYEHPGFGQVTPIAINPPGGGAATRGFGRFYTLSEIAIDFTKEPQIPATTTAPIQPARPPLLADQIIVVGNLYLGLYSPSLGPGQMEPAIRVVVEGLDAFKISDGITTQKNGASQVPVFSHVHGWTSYSTIPHAVRYHGGGSYPFLWGGATGPRELYADKTTTYLADGTVNASTSSYSLDGNPWIFDDRGKLALSAGTLTIKIYNASVNAFNAKGEGSPGQPGEQLLQTITVNFPGFANLPMPTNAFENRYKTTYNLNDRLSAGGYTPGDFYGRDDAAHAVSGNDTIRSMVVSYNGDARLVAAQSNVTAGFVKHPQFDSALKCVHSLRDINPYYEDSPPNYPLSPSNPPPLWRFASNGFIPAVSPGTSLVTGASYNVDAQPMVGFTDPTKYPAPDVTGDWDNGLSILPDGPYINKPDEVNTQYFADPTNTVDPSYLPYYHTTDIVNDLTMAKSYSSPNRALASPVMFGSLPTGVVSNTPWQTLLFRPQQNHPGQNSPKDSLLLDWFWMPVVEPYAISTPMATSGKVNMNYQIAPFTYIKRATAVMGVLGSEYVIAVPTSDGNKYKTGSPANYRSPVKVLENDNVTAADASGSLRQFKAKFDSNQIFKSASDICDIYLVPTGQSWSSDADAENFWKNNKLTGDNSRERPYNGLYSRLTTKSNTFTVHVRAQAVRAPVSGDPTIWVENPMTIQSEYRGSVTVNRYLDPEDTNIPNFVTDKNAQTNGTLDKYYKYRVLETRRFLP